LRTRFEPGNLVGMQTLYDILGLTNKATPEQIKTTFRKLARDIHPDTALNKDDAENKFKDNSNAYSILSNPRERARYDRGEIDENGSPLRNSNTDQKSNSAFDGFNKRRHPGSDDEIRNIRVDGSDVLYVLWVEFSDAVNGATKHISITNGKRFSVNIPAGTKNKQMLRLKGQGIPGAGGGKDGAALVKILINDHALFRIQGNDILIDQRVPLKLAILGGSLQT